MTRGPTAQWCLLKMTVSVAFDGTVIDTADTAANWTAVKITSGGGGPTAIASDAPYEGTNNVTCRSDNKKVYMYTDIGAGNELDFTASGNADGDMFYIWVNFLPSPLLNTQAGGGLGVFMESRTPSSSVYSLWYFHGRDTYTGGWVRLAIDPNKAPSETSGAGSFDPAAVRYFGAFAYNNQGTAKYDNFVVDQCAHGKGLIVTGSSTLGLVEELLVNEEANRHGVVTALNESGTAAELLGKLTLGDDVGVLAANITDENSKIFVAEPLFYETTLKAACPLGFSGLAVVGNGTGATDLAFGQQVGTTQGRNGISLVGNDTYDVGLDTDDGAVESSDWFGCSLEDLTGTLRQDGVHNYDGVSMSGCAGLSVANSNTLNNLTSVGSGQINLNASGKLANALIINNTATAAILTTDLGDITVGDLTSDGTGHGVELTSIGGGTMSWDVVSSGYDVGSSGSPVTPTSTGDEDIYVNVGSGTLTINVAAGATIPSIRSAGATVNIVSGLITILVNVKDDSTGLNLPLAHVWLGKVSDKSTIINGATDASGNVSVDIADPGLTDCLGWARQMDHVGTDYTPKDIAGQITSSGLTISVRLSPI